MTWLLLASVSERDLVSLVARLADVFDALVSVLLRLSVVEWLLEAFRLAFSDLAEVDDELTFEAEFSVSADWLALLDVLAAVLALPLVVLLDDPPLAAVRVSVEEPPVDEVAPPPEALLVCDELPDDAALLGGLRMETVGVLAVAPVALVDAVLLLVFARLADALSVSEADLTLLALCELFADAARVAASDLLELVVKLFVLVSLLLCELLEERLRVSVELLVSVSLCEWVASSWLFAPRL
jgi:hypothetical protein